MSAPFTAAEKELAEWLRSKAPARRKIGGDTWRSVQMPASTYDRLVAALNRDHPGAVYLGD